MIKSRRHDTSWLWWCRISSKPRRFAVKLADLPSFARIVQRRVYSCDVCRVIRVRLVFPSVDFGFIEAFHLSPTCKVGVHSLLSVRAEFGRDCCASSTDYCCRQQLQLDVRHTSACKTKYRGLVTRCIVPAAWATATSPKDRAW